MCADSAKWVNRIHEGKQKELSSEIFPMNPESLSPCSFSFFLTLTSLFVIWMKRNAPNELPAHCRALCEQLEIHNLAQGYLSGAVAPFIANRTSIFCLHWGLIVQTGSWTKNPLFLSPVPCRLSYHHAHITTSPHLCL